MASINDEKVLSFMFDPFLLEVNAEVENNNNQNGHIDHQELTTAQLESKQLEIKAVEAANENRLDEANELFDRAIKLWPEKASILNNRAQLYRLLARNNDAMQDLDRAILLCEANNDLLTGRQAYCQRALIHLLNENKEQGLKDMSKSAEMGNSFAKSYMAKINPYAALCNKMLQEMFQQYRLPNST